jgi:hypothetical protein
MITLIEERVSLKDMYRDSDIVPDVTPSWDTDGHPVDSLETLQKLYECALDAADEDMIDNINRMYEDLMDTYTPSSLSSSKSYPLYSFQKEVA